MPSLTWSLGQGVKASGCTVIAPNWSLCISGSVKVEAGPCCKADGSEGEMIKMSGSISLTVHLGIKWGWKMEPTDPVSISSMPSCPTRDTFKLSGSVTVGVSASALGASVSLAIPELTWSGEASFSYNVFSGFSLYGGGTITASGAKLNE